MVFCLFCSRWFILIWFKHETDADESESLNLIIGKYGMAGYGRWYRLLEIVAAKMDCKTDRCSVSYPLSYWGNKLDLSPRAAWDFLKTCEQFIGISVETTPELTSSLSQTGVKLQINSKRSRNELVLVTIPNLLKKRDSHNKTR